VNAVERQLKDTLIDYCAKIGTDPLLVQGAGGNASWKDGDTLWVKASGTWLANAATADIFVPVDLDHLCNALQREDFSVTPKLNMPSGLKPSIETLLHALMPHPVVIHLHPVEVLAHLVRGNCQPAFESLIAPSLPWTIVDYCKPGATLAAAVRAALIQKPTATVVFLKNHGVVIGGADVAQVSQTLDQLTSALKTVPVETDTSAPESTALLDDRYTSIADHEIQQLALNEWLFKRLSSDWALYPDHVVFLGPRAHVFRSVAAFQQAGNAATEPPDLVFIYRQGVYVRQTFSHAQRAQLRCYYDVVSRQPSDAPIRSLTNQDVSELLNWDAERYRMMLRN